MNDAGLREAIYAGEVLRLEAGPASRALAAAVRAQLVACPGLPEDFERAHRELAPEELHARLRPVRRALVEEPRFTELARAVLTEAGLDAESYLLDPPRLRAVAPGAHRLDAARAAFSLHRDTWYANPSAQINLWVPLVPVDEPLAMQLYPRAFDRPLANQSRDFDLEAFLGRAEVAAARDPAAVVYPELQEEPPGEPVLLTAEAESVLVFSAAHLHGTRGHDEDRIRFSVDFRAVHPDDRDAGRGAPNVDDRSRGDASRGYRA